MKRLDESKKTAAVTTKMDAFHADIVNEVAAAVDSNDVLIVGMKQNPVVRKAKKQLDNLSVKYAYLEYGSYSARWKDRLALKIWAGWPTFPMIFVKGTLIGGSDDLKALVDSGEFDKLRA
jgi:monothiol glutaredoxin